MEKMPNLSPEGDPKLKRIDELSEEEIEAAAKEAYEAEEERKRKAARDAVFNRTQIPGELARIIKEEGGEEDSPDTLSSQPTQATKATQTADLKKAAEELARKAKEASKEAGHEPEDVNKGYA